MITFFNRIELWDYPGSWRRTGEWVFSIDHSCYNGCIIISIGFIGITILKGECITKDKWFSVRPRD